MPFTLVAVTLTAWLARSQLAQINSSLSCQPPGSPIQWAGSVPFLQEREKKSSSLTTEISLSLLCSNSERSGLVWPYLTLDPETKALSKLVTKRVRLLLSAPSSLFAGLGWDLGKLQSRSKGFEGHGCLGDIQGLFIHSLDSGDCLMWTKGQSRDLALMCGLGFKVCSEISLVSDIEDWPY